MASLRPAPVHSSRRRARLAGAALAILWFSAGLGGALGVGTAALGATPVGSEFQVNTYTTGSQIYSSVAVDAGGDFVVVWESEGSAGTDTSSRSIQGQRYGASGNALGAEFQVNTYTTDSQYRPSVAVEANGDFVVVWESEGSAGTDTSSRSIQGQRYGASGNALGAEFQVNTYTTGLQWRPSVAADADGNSVVVWEGPKIQGQRYDASGNALGAEFQVNTYTSGWQAVPSVAVEADGDFVVVWESYGSPGNDSFWASIQGRRYDASGNAVGAQFQVNTYTSGWQGNPSVAIDSDGDFVVVWQGYGSSGNDTSYWCIQGRRYDASGNAVGADFQVNTLTAGYQVSPSVAADAARDFVVVWESYLWGGGDSWIKGQHYDANGNGVGSEFQVNTYTTSYSPPLSNPSVAAGGNGDFVVVWESYGSAGSDTSYWSIQGQSYIVQSPQVPSLSPPGLIGLAVVLFGIAGTVLWRRRGSRR